MNSRYFWVTALLLPTLTTLASMASAQDRESLKNPVYRLDNGSVESAPLTQLAVADPGPAPEATATPTSKPVTEATADEKAAVDREATVEPVGRMAKQEPVGITTEPSPAKSVAEHPSCVTLNCAIKDAKQILTHIKTNIRDYTCDFVKRERINGVLSPIERIDLKVRNRVEEDGQIKVPLAVYLKYRAPKDNRNREILYVEGKTTTRSWPKRAASAVGCFLPFGCV